MPLYSYECKTCGNEFEMVKPVCEWSLPQICPNCGDTGRRIIANGHGGSHDDNPAWLDNSVRAMIQDLDNPNTRPIETRQQLKKYLKDNGLVATG